MAEYQALQMQTYTKVKEDSVDNVAEEYTEGRRLMDQLSQAILGNDESKKVLYDTPTDTWGVVLYVISKDLGDIAAGDATMASRIFRIVYSFACLLINLALQFMILVWVFEYVVFPSVAEIQSNYKTYHRECFDSSGSFVQKQWDNFDAGTKHSLCQAGVSQPAFLFSILFLWTLAMLGEFHENLRLHRHIRQIHDLPPGVSHVEQVQESQSSGLCFLIALSWMTRALIYCLIVIPKYIIIFTLTYIGWVWLSSSQDFAGMILNSLALGFVVTIDDLMFVSLFPEKVTERVKELKLACPAPIYANDQEKRDAADSEVKRSIGRSMALVVIAMVALWAFVESQEVLPGYESDLRSICRASLQQLPCSFNNYLRRDCFPKGPAGAEV